MSAGLTIRKIPFDFEGVEFIWNPANPRFSIEMNKVSFFAVGLERYFCRAVRDAEPLLRDPGALAQAQAFREQESVHSLAHRKHVNALAQRYPGLRQGLEKLVAHFDALYEARPLAFHLAYAGGLESIFTPSFRMMLDNREQLFGGGDARVASLFLWHFCEEVEHRSAALDVYNHVVGSYWFRLRNTPRFARHVAQGLALLEAEFRQHVPAVPAQYYRLPMNADVPVKDRLAAGAGVLASLLPWHHPSSQREPAYFAQWKARYDRGEDMTQVFGVKQ